MNAPHETVCDECYERFMNWHTGRRKPPMSAMGDQDLWRDVDMRFQADND